MYLSCVCDDKRDTMKCNRFVDVNDRYKRQLLEFQWTPIVFLSILNNENIDIKSSAHATFLE